MGLGVQYWSTQSDNLQLSTFELGYKALSLFAISVYPRVSDLARLARDQTRILATATRYCYQRASVGTGLHSARRHILCGMTSGMSGRGYTGVHRTYRDPSAKEYRALWNDEEHL